MSKKIHELCKNQPAKQKEKDMEKVKRGASKPISDYSASEKILGLPFNDKVYEFKGLINLLTQLTWAAGIPEPWFLCGLKVKYKPEINKESIKCSWSSEETATCFTYKAFVSDHRPVESFSSCNEGFSLCNVEIYADNLNDGEELPQKLMHWVKDIPDQTWHTFLWILLSLQALCADCPGIKDSKALCQCDKQVGVLSRQRVIALGSKS